MKELQLDHIVSPIGTLLMVADDAHILTGYGPGLERKRWLLQHEGNMRKFSGSNQDYK